MFSKRAVVISTAAGAGMKSTNKDVADSLSFWGIPKIYKIGFGIHATSWSKVSDKMLAKIRKKTDSIAAKLKSDSFEPKVSAKGRMYFTISHFANKKGWNPADSSYWQAKGWTENKRPWKK